MKNMKLGLGLSAMALGLLLPLSAMAAEPKATPSSVAFCSRLDDVAVQVEQAIVDKEERRYSDIGEKDVASYIRSATRDSKSDQARAQSDATKALRIKDFEKRAKSDLERAAISSFEIAVGDATSTRKSAIETALSKYEEGATALLAKRTVAFDEMLSSFRKNMEAVVAEAVLDCTSEASTKTARFAYISGITNVQDAFGEERDDYGSVKEQMKPLIEARKKSVQEAEALFDTAIEKARETLKEAFK